MNLVRNWLGVEGFVITDEDDNRLAGPFQSIQEVRAYLVGYRDAITHTRQILNELAIGYIEMRDAYEADK